MIEQLSKHVYYLPTTILKVSLKQVSLVARKLRIISKFLVLHVGKSVHQLGLIWE